jgi:hypothetical protein
MTGQSELSGWVGESRLRPRPRIFMQPGSQQAHNQSDAQDKHTKTLWTGPIFGCNLFSCSDRQYLYRDRQCLSDSPFSGII